MIEELNPIEKTYRELLALGQPPLRMYSGNPTEHGILFPSEILLKSYQEYFALPDYHPDPKGLLVAREAISGYYASQGLALNPEHCLLTSGSSESFLHLFSLLAKAGDNILVPRPGYPLFEPIAEILGVELRHYSLRESEGWSLEVDEVSSQADRRTRALVLVSPGNPTGVVHGAEELERLVAWSNARDLPLICDEVFSEFYFGPGSFPRVVKVSQPKLAFTLNGISKMFALPALKCSWIAVTGESARVASAVDRLEMLTDTFLTCHTPIQKALPRLFSEAQDFLRTYQSEVLSRRNLAVQLLSAIPGISLVEPRGGFYLMFRLDSERTDSEEGWVIELMRKKGVFFHPGYFYDWEEGLHGVLSFLVSEADLKFGLKALAEFLLHT